MVRFAVSLMLLVASATGCHSSKTPELRVLGVNDNTADSHVFVQVTNPAERPMRLTKLEYTFASASNGATVAEGELALAREVPAGAAVIVDIPLEAEATETLMLRGKLTAELDEIVRSFRVSAQIQPH
jgi:LEA14-like dessication related protein